MNENSNSKSLVSLKIKQREKELFTLKDFVYDSS